MKPPLVLIPGMLSNGLVWTHQVKNLSAGASIQVIEAVQDTPEKMVAQILKRAPPYFAVAGHSMGGWLCLELMKQAPSRIVKLALINTTARPDSDEKRSRRRRLIDRTLAGEFDAIVEELAALFVFDDKVRHEVVSMFQEVGPEAFVNQQRAMLARGDTFFALPHIHVPALVIHAALDENFSLEEHQELSETIPGAKLAVVEGSGHMSPMERPEVITGLIREWLASPSNSLKSLSL
ncbi:alpha/beta fold hydrolase [Estrella lausannensis]|uniref:Alpha/beta family hydrolase n=1 Tax=Estrella lausannensis TaxID=483423 RepID=A0A0H5DMY6_9BACT|nr:alpha/beta hydrolase [Estrella lausannensis]CRX37561.1 alpha/beta family hydrolase [Estrella lausannensis]